jgi:hypothetical protein
MVQKSIFSRFMGRLIVDPCVRRGIVPKFGRGGAWFGQVASSRVIRPAKSHPISMILQHDDWKTSFSISDHTLLWLWQFLARHRPKSILELGSGMSTLVFAKYIEQCPEAEKPRFVSVDHDPAWLGVTETRIKELRLQSYVCLQQVSVQPLAFDGPFNSRPGYDVNCSALADHLGSPDLIFIDGPPSTIGRSATFPAIFPLLKAPSNVLVDDASRSAETEMMAEWGQYFKGLHYVGKFPLGNGLGHLQFSPQSEK